MPNGQEVQETVRVVIMREHEYFVAQCLEHDIAVQGGTVEEVIQRFQETVSNYVILATEHGDRPFENLEPAPKSYEHAWANASKLGMLAASLDLKLSVVTDQPVPQTARMAVA